MQLNPRETFTIVRQIEDHTDQATYYVRAVIRNAKTDAIIQVDGNNYVNLTDQGSQRFTKNWLVPADASGQGFYISILTSVYTDSGYTTKSENYGDKIETYLVQDRVNANLGGLGGGGGSDIDYKKIRKIVDEVVKQRLKEDIDMPEMPEFPEIPPFPEFPEMPDVVAPLKEAVGEIKRTIVANKPEATDLSSLSFSLEKIVGLLGELQSTTDNVATKEKLEEVYDCVEEIKSVTGESGKAIGTLSVGARELINALVKLGFGGVAESLFKMHEAVKEDSDKANPKPTKDPRVTSLIGKK